MVELMRTEAGKRGGRQASGTREQQRPGGSRESVEGAPAGRKGGFGLFRTTNTGGGLPPRVPFLVAAGHFGGRASG